MDTLKCWSSCRCIESYSIEADSKADLSILVQISSFKTEDVNNFERAYFFQMVVFFLTASKEENTPIIYQQKWSICFRFLSLDLHMKYAFHSRSLVSTQKSKLVNKHRHINNLHAYHGYKNMAIIVLLVPSYMKIALYIVAFENKISRAFEIIPIDLFL